MKIDSSPQPSFDQQRRRTFFYQVEEDDTIVVTDVFGAVVTTIEAAPAPRSEGGRAKDVLRDEEHRAGDPERRVTAALVALGIRLGDAVLQCRGGANPNNRAAAPAAGLTRRTRRRVIPSSHSFVPGGNGSPIKRGD